MNKKIIDCTEWKIKLSYKWEGLEKLFLQLIRKKLTNLDKLSPLNYHKILNTAFLFPLLDFRKNPPQPRPLTWLVLNFGPPPFYKGGRKKLCHSIYRGINSPSKKPLFLSNPPLNLQTVQDPLFRISLPSVLVFRKLLPP